MKAEPLDSLPKFKDGKPETLAPRLRAYLRSRATGGVPITYQEAAQALLLLPPNTIHQVTEALEQLMVEDAAAERPFIAAMVISKARRGVPAPGFFECAERLGRFAGDATILGACSFYEAELSATIKYWGQPSAVDLRG